MRRWYLVAYDISNNKVRKAAEKACCTYLQRVQYSVFEGNLSEINFQSLQKRIKEISQLKQWNAASDSVHIYYQCNACYGKQIVIGKNQKKGKDYFIV